MPLGVLSGRSGTRRESRSPSSFIALSQMIPMSSRGPQLRDSLNRNYPAAQVKEALESLERDGRAKRRKRKNPNGGRPAELWRAITPETAATPQRSDRPVLTRVA